jgi:hypothetical protein
VAKNVAMEKSVWLEVFAKTDEPLGWWLAGWLSNSNSQVRFEYRKKSAEGGCSWGEVGYAGYFKVGVYVAKDEKAYVQRLEKAAEQNNPWAMDLLGDWFEEHNDNDKALEYYRAAAKLGWKDSQESICDILSNTDEEAVIRSAQVDDLSYFWEYLTAARLVLEGKRKVTDSYRNFDRYCYSLGYSLFWYVDVDELWEDASEFAHRCLDYYCSCIEMQQNSILTFLWCWNRTAGGIKGPGQMIAQMVWEGREENLLKGFEIKSE